MEFTHLIDHIGQQAFNLVIVDLFLTAEADGGCELGNWHAGAANGLLPFLCILKATGNEDLPQQVAQRDIAAAFQRKVNASLDELVLALLKGEVKLVELAPLDAPAERQEELLQPWIGLQ
jgi:hypothetical protein